MHGFLKALFIVLAGLNAWIALGYLVFVVDAGSLPASDYRVPATMFLLLLAPALTFIPLARLLNAALYEVEGLLGWASFGFVLTFVTPGPSLTRTEFLIFLLPLVVVIATIATLVSYAFGYRIYRGTAAQRDFLRARRQGYVVGLVVVALFLLHGIQVLSLVNGALLVTIAVLCEVVMLSRDRPVNARRRVQSGSPQRS
jgi:hypothetical protein